MTLPHDELVYGYWPARQLRGDFPAPIRDPGQLPGGSTLNIACTQTTLSRSQQDKLVDAWCELLPTLRVKTLLLSSKVPQRLFEAACAVPGLEALSIKWSSICSLDPISGLTSLRSLYIGSSPGIARLDPLSELKTLEHLFIAAVQDPVDLSFATDLVALREFGLSAARGRRMRVDSLEPLRSLGELELLWLVSVQVLHGGLAPLHGLRKLSSLRSTIRSTSPEFHALRAAVPTLVHFQPVG